jgi:hypothetical protein
MIDEYTTARECYETETEIIVIGGVAHDDESHNCDEMGCGSATPHIKYRIKKSELAALRARDEGCVERVAREMYNCCSDGGGPWDERTSAVHSVWSEAARAVLAAADGREP